MRLLTLFLILFCHLCTAQLVVEPIKIDFKAKKIISQPTASQLRSADYVQVQIDNIEAKSYLVRIDKKDSIIAMGTPPALFSALSFGDGYTKLLANLADFTVGAVVTEVVSPKGAESDGMDFITEKLAFGRAEKMAGFAKQLSANKATAIKATKTPDDLMAIMKEMRHDLFDAHYTFKTEVIDEADDLILNFNLNDDRSGIANCDSFEAKAKRILSCRTSLSKQLERKYLIYYDEILPNYTLLAQNISLLKADSMIERYRKDFFTFLGKFDSAFNKTIIPKYCAVLNAQAPVTQFLSLPYPVRGKDVNTLSIKITPLDTSKNKQGYETEIPLHHYPNRLWAFTSGVYLGTLSSEQYSFRANTRQQPGTTPAKYDTLGYTLLGDQKDKVQAGISALLHVGEYFNSNTNWGWHIAAGPGLSLESKPRPRILIGAGLVCGRHDKITFTASWIGGPVKTLKSAYEGGKDYQGAPADIMKDSFKSGFAISLGYALFGK